MLECDAVRERLALGAIDADLDDHITSCGACATYQRRNNVLDGVLRSELMRDVPAALTAQLLALAALPLSALPPLRPPGWYINLVAALTFGAVTVSVLLIIQGIGFLAAQVGLAAVPELLWSQLSAWLGQFGDLTRLMVLGQNLAMWTLASALLWIIFDRVVRPIQTAAR
jgi:hypothetical protein